VSRIDRGDLDHACGQDPFGVAISGKLKLRVRSGGGGDEVTKGTDVPGGAGLGGSEKRLPRFLRIDVVAPRTPSLASHRFVIALAVVGVFLRFTNMRDRAACARRTLLLAVETINTAFENAV